MNYFDWVTIGLVIVQLAAFGLSWTDWQARRTLIAVESPGLRALPESTSRALAHRLVLRSRAGIVAGLIGYVASYGWLRATSHPITFGDVYVSVLIFGLCFAGGTIVMATRQQLAASGSPLRVARVRAITIGDYVPASLRVSGWIGVACVVAAVSIQDTLQLTHPPLVAGEQHTLVSNSLIAAFALIGMVTFEIAGRAIVAHPQPAGSSDELMWDDAVRAATLRDLARLPVLLGAYAFIFAIVRGLDWTYGAASIVVFGLFTICLASLLVTVLVSRSSREHYLDRLWSSRPRSDFDDAPDVSDVTAAVPSAVGGSR